MVIDAFEEIDHRLACKGQKERARYYASEPSRVVVAHPVDQGVQVDVFPARDNVLSDLLITQTSVELLPVKVDVPQFASHRLIVETSVLEDRQGLTVEAKLEPHLADPLDYVYGLFKVCPLLERGVEDD